METITTASSQTLQASRESQIAEEENNRRISSSVLDELRQTGMLKLFLPQSLGGLEKDPVTVARLVEKVSTENTTAGWSMMVSNVSAWWCRALSEKGVETIFEKGSDTFIAGAFHPPMQAVRVNGGFQINGRSPLTSNVHEADFLSTLHFPIIGISMGHYTSFQPLAQVSPA